MRSRQMIFVIALVLVNASLAAQQPETSAVLPATPAGRQFAAWLDMLNSGDAAVFRISSGSPTLCAATGC